MSPLEQLREWREAGMTRKEFDAMGDDVFGVADFRDRYALATLDRLILDSWSRVAVAKVLVQKYGFAPSTARNIAYLGADQAAGMTKGTLKADAQKRLAAMKPEAIASARAALHAIAERD